MAASSGGHCEIVKLLVEEDRSLCRLLPWLDSRDHISKRTALMRASRGNHPEIVRLLLSSGANPNLRDDVGETALFHAARHHGVVMKLLLDDARTNVDAKNNKYETVLHVATCKSELSTVLLLLAHVADALLIDAYGKDALDLARLTLDALEEEYYSRRWDYQSLIHASDRRAALSRAQ